MLDRAYMLAERIIAQLERIIQLLEEIRGRDRAGR